MAVPRVPRPSSDGQRRRARTTAAAMSSRPTRRPFLNSSPSHPHPTVARPYLLKAAGLLPSPSFSLSLPLPTAKTKNNRAEQAAPTRRPNPPSPLHHFPIHAAHSYLPVSATSTTTYFPSPSARAPGVAATRHHLPHRRRPPYQPPLRQPTTKNELLVSPW